MNRVEPSGLFFGFLKKLFGFALKILRVVAIVVAVAMIVVAALNIGNPMVGVWAIADLFMKGGALLAGALGAPKLAQVFGAAGGVASIYQQGPGAIWNFAPTSGASSGGRLPPWSIGIGSIVNFLQPPNSGVGGGVPQETTNESNDLELVAKLSVARALMSPRFNSAPRF